MREIEAIEGMNGVYPVKIQEGGKRIYGSTACSFDGCFPQYCFWGHKDPAGQTHCKHFKGSFDKETEVNKNKMFTFMVNCSWKGE